MSGPSGALRVDLGRLAAGAAGEGAVWHPTDTSDLRLNLIRLEPDGGVAPHVNDDVEVVIVGVSGTGTVTVGGQRLPLGPAVLVLVPKGAERAVEAGPEPVTYLSVHRHRGAGLRIGVG